MSDYGYESKYKINTFWEHERVQSTEQPNPDPRDLQKEKLKLLQWNYEQCMSGYHSRDQMTNDIFYKMINAFILYIGLLSLSFLARISDPATIRIYLGLLFLVSTGSLVALLLILQSMINCKIALRKQCTFIEEKINNRYIKEIVSLKDGKQCTFNQGKNESECCFVKEYLAKGCKDKHSDYLDKKYNQYWECICQREGCFKSDSDEEKGYILTISKFLVVVWVVIVLYLILYPEYLLAGNNPTV